MHIWILSLLVLWFLLWFFSSIVLPDVKNQTLRELFALRDDLRRQGIEYPQARDDEEFKRQQAAINVSIDRVSKVGFASFLRTRRDQNPIFAKFWNWSGKKAHE